MNDSTATIRDVWAHPDALARHLRETGAGIESRLTNDAALLNACGPGLSIRPVIGDLLYSRRAPELCLPAVIRSGPEADAARRRQAMRIAARLVTAILADARAEAAVLAAVPNLVRDPTGVIHLVGAAPDPPRLTTRIGDLA